MKHKLNKEYFNNIDTEEKAYWLGFIAADGCIYKMSKTAYRLQINLSLIDINHLQKFNECIESDYNITTKNINSSDTCTLKIACKQLTDGLIKHGITPKKSLTVEMPELRDDLYRHFIRGYFDGDGCITYNFDYLYPKMAFSIVGGESMLLAINEHMNQDMSIYTCNHSPALTLTTAKKDKIVQIYHYLYDDSTIYLDRKKEKFDYLMSRLTGM